MTPPENQKAAAAREENQMTEITREQLASALEGFYVTARTVTGTCLIEIADPDGTASAILDTLGRMAALREDRPTRSDADLDRAYVINGDDLRIALSGTEGRAPLVPNPRDIAAYILGRIARPLDEERAGPGMHISRGQLARALADMSVTIIDKDGLKLRSGSFRGDTLVTSAEGPIMWPDELADMLLDAIRTKGDPAEVDETGLGAVIPAGTDPELSAMAVIVGQLESLSGTSGAGIQSTIRVLTYIAGRYGYVLADED